MADALARDSSMDYFTEAMNIFNRSYFYDVEDDVVDYAQSMWEVDERKAKRFCLMKNT